MSSAFEYGSADLGNYGLTVLTADDPVLSDVNLDEQEVAGMGGAVLQGATRKCRYWTMVCQVTGTTADELRGYLDSIAVALDPVNGTKLLTVDREQELGAALRRGRWARLNGPIGRVVKLDLTARIDLHWMSPYAYDVGVSETTQSVTVNSNPKTWVVPAAGVVAGNETNEPVIVITVIGGAVTGVVLANTTRTETLTWTGSLGAADKLRVDLARRHIEKSTNGGTTWTNAMSGKAAGSAWPLLSAGVSNGWSLAGITGTATVGFTYRARWK